MNYRTLATVHHATNALVGMDAGNAPTLSEWLLGAAGAAVGYYFWVGHPILGVLTGYSLGNGVAKIGTKPEEAALQIGGAGTSIAGALLWKTEPVLGWLGGGVAVGIPATLAVVTKKSGG